MRHTPNRGSRQGFTLIEMLVVIAIIWILLAILPPAIRSSRENAKRAYCMNNMMEIGKGLMMYAADHEDHLPLMPGTGSGEEISWATRILPYVGYSTNLFRCPSDPVSSAGGAIRTYAANGIPDGWPQNVPFGSMGDPSGGSFAPPKRLSDLDYNRGDLILLGERPGIDSGNRGLIDNDWFVSLDLGTFFTVPAELANVPHERGKGCNYLMSSMAVKYIRNDDVMAVPAGTRGNYFTIVTSP